MEFFLLRALERILIVVVGGLSIYLGYRLFANIQVGGEGEAQVKLPGNITLLVSKVGPGVFFALFGALVVGASLAFPVSYSESILQTGSDIDLATRNISGIGPGTTLGSDNGQINPALPSKVDASSLELKRLRVREQIALLNQIPGILDPSLSSIRLKRVNDRLLAGKLHLIKSVWGPDWGSFEQFQLWAEDGSKPGTSEAFSQARTFFNYGQARQ